MSKKKKSNTPVEPPVVSMELVVTQRNLLKDVTIDDMAFIVDQLAEYPIDDSEMTEAIVREQDRLRKLLVDEATRGAGARSKLTEELKQLSNDIKGLIFTQYAKCEHPLLTDIIETNDHPYLMQISKWSREERDGDRILKIKVLSNRLVITSFKN